MTGDQLIKDLVRVAAAMDKAAHELVIARRYVTEALTRLRTGERPETVLVELDRLLGVAKARGMEPWNN